MMHRHTAKPPVASVVFMALVATTGIRNSSADVSLAGMGASDWQEDLLFFVFPSARWGKRGSLCMQEEEMLCCIRSYASFCTDPDSLWVFFCFCVLARRIEAAAAASRALFKCKVLAAIFLSRFFKVLSSMYSSNDWEVRYRDSSSLFAMRGTFRVHSGEESLRSRRNCAL